MPIFRDANLWRSQILRLFSRPVPSPPPPPPHPTGFANVTHPKKFFLIRTPYLLLPPLPPTDQFREKNVDLSIRDFKQEIFLLFLFVTNNVHHTRK